MKTLLHTYSINKDGDEYEVSITNDSQERVLVYTIDSLVDAERTAQQEVRRFDFGYYNQ